jgi:hypothetical protein
MSTKIDSPTSFKIEYLHIQQISLSQNKAAIIH